MKKKLKKNKKPVVIQQLNKVVGGRRAELDHVGAYNFSGSYNFMVEISGVNAG